MDLKERYLTLLKSIREILKNENQMHISSIKKKMDTILDECLQLENEISKEKEWEVGGSGLTEEDKQEINNSLLELKSKIDNQDKKIDENSSQIDENMNLLNARMDTFTKLEEGSTTGDAELKDIRVGADGEIYESAGEAVRKQVDNLKSGLIYKKMNEQYSVGDSSQSPTYPFECTTEGYIIAFNQNKAISNITSISLRVYANAIFNVYKVNDSNLSANLLTTLENTDSSSKIIEHIFSEPISLNENEHIAISNTQQGKHLQLYYNSEITNGNAIRYTLNGEKLSNKKSLPNFNIFLQINYLTENNVYVNDAMLHHKIVSPLNGKKIVFLGDSFTANADRYINNLVELCGCIPLNYGVGGTRMVKSSASDTTQNFEIRYPNMDDDADMVVVFGGTNDFEYGNCLFGEFTDGANPNKYTFYAGLHRLFSGLYNKYLDKPILVVTPCHRSNTLKNKPEFTVALDGTLTAVTSDIGKTLKEYVNAIKEVAQFYSFHIADAYSFSGFNPIDNQHYMGDGLHPSSIGSMRLSKWMLRELENAYIDVVGF